MTLLCDKEIASYCQPHVPHSRMRVFHISANYSSAKYNYNKTVRGSEDAASLIAYLRGGPQYHVAAIDLIDKIDKLQVNETASIFAESAVNPNITILRQEDAKPMIEGFEDQSVRINAQGQKVLSYGLSSAGYDFRVAPEFKIFHNAASQLVDPKNFDPNAFITHKGDHCIIPPNSFVLSHTVERFNMPEDIVGLCAGKSTLARVGIFPLVTPAEPEWDGFLTLEFANLTPLPAKIYANEGGLQMLFQKIQRPAVTYKDRGGKYMGQAAEVVLPKV